MRRKLVQGDYRLLAEFRHLLRQFQSFSEAAARAADTTPQQHQALLAVRGTEGPMGTSTPAGRLASKVHSAVELANRLQSAGLLRRVPDPRDRRRVLLRLTPR